MSAHASICIFACQHLIPFAHLLIYPHICTFTHLHNKMILVTGATGFLGSEVAKQLVLGGNRIRCIKRSSSKIPALLSPFDKNITWVEADLLDIFALGNALAEITQVYNCAAFVSLKQADKEPMIYTNVTGTGNLVNLCVQNGIRLVHVSSVAAVGQAKPGELINEKHHLDQAAETDGYAISKLESEMEVWRGIAEGLDAVIVNPSIIIGASAGVEGSGALFETVRKGLKFYTLGSMGFVDVEDVAKCMIALMNSGIHSERFIVSAENHNYKDLTAEIAQCFGIKPPATLAKPWMMELAWRGAALAAAITCNPPAIDKVSARAASITRNFDNSKIKKATGMEFKPLNESVKEVCQALKTV
ncbi:MAG: family NAD(P)-dependent oxidoreductase [Mucilaginibacter sp.]|nr:family NAD(P)-dependent oxidoreductase [Mucilaginibacter sp.]